LALKLPSLLHPFRRLASAGGSPGDKWRGYLPTLPVHCSVRATSLTVSQQQDVFFVKHWDKFTVYLPTLHVLCSVRNTSRGVSMVHRNLFFYLAARGTNEEYFYYYSPSGHRHMLGRLFSAPVRFLIWHAAGQMLRIFTNSSCALLCKGYRPDHLYTAAVSFMIWHSKGQMWRIFTNSVRALLRQGGTVEL
jgi:hypothetical protein